MYWEKMEATWQPRGARVGSRELGRHSSNMGLEEEEGGGVERWSREGGVRVGSVIWRRQEGEKIRVRSI